MGKTRDRFYGGMIVRLANLIAAPINATHPWAQSYALGLRIEPEAREAQHERVSDIYLATHGALDIGTAAIFSSWAFPTATTDPIAGRLNSSADSQWDEAWKAGASAADAYGIPLDQEFGNGSADKQRAFEAYGRESLQGEGLPPWGEIMIALRPSLKQNADQAEIKRRLARNVLGSSKADADSFLPQPTGPTMTTLPTFRRENIFNIVPQVGRVDPNRIFGGIARMGEGPAAPTTPPAPASSAAPIGGAVGAAAGGAAGYFLGGRSLVVAGVAALAGGALGYFAAPHVAKP